MTIPLITCICLTRYPERASMLRDALHAFTLQTYPSCRLLVVNDGQPLRVVPSRFQVEVLHCESGLTIGAKRQRGLLHAGDSWVSTWDDDDFFLPTHLQAMADTASAHQAVVVRNRLHALTDERLRVASVVHRPAPASVLLWGPRVQFVGGYYNQPYAEDWSLYARLQLDKAPTALSRALTYFHRRHTGNVSQAYESALWSSDRQVVECLENQKRWPQPKLTSLQMTVDKLLRKPRVPLVELA